jgi:ribosome recycling factor
MAGDDVDLVIEEAREGMDKAFKSLRIDLQKVRTGRANPSLLDGIQVDYYGTPTPLNQLANLSAPEPSLILVSPYDKGALGAIEKAIRASDLGLQPSNDGKLVRIPIPTLTEERRKELVKHVKKLSEHHKIGVREARREALAALKALEGDGTLPADERHRAEKRVQDLTDASVKRIDDAAEQKEAEILQV